MATTPTPSTPATQGFGRAIDRLRKAANFEPVVHTIELDDGSEFQFQSTPLTASERERAQKEGKSTNDFAISLLIIKGQELDGQPLFKRGDIAALKNEVPEEILQKMILCVLRPGKDEEDNIDMKSSEG